MSIEKKVNFEPLSPLLFLERSARYYKNKKAIVDGDITKTYSEFYRDCQAIAKGLCSLGIKPNAKVAYVCRNTHHMVAAFYAIPMCRSVLMPINVRLNYEQIAYILQHAEADVLFIEECFFHESYINDVNKIVIIGTKKYEHPNVFSYEELLNIGNENRHLQLPILTDEQETITLNYTSGTTGNPKGAEYSHRSTYLNALGECLQTGLTNQSNYLWILPMFHCNGWCFPWAVTAVAGTHVCLPTINAEEIIRLIVEHDITHLCAAPTILTMLPQTPAFSKLAGKTNLKIITAGSSPTEKTIKTYEEFGIDIIHVYGLTETHGPHTVNPTPKNTENVSVLKTYQGIPGIHATFMRIVDKQMQDIPHDGVTIGEVIMRGNNIMKGYYKDPATTEISFKNGWFFSGDLAVVHPNGFMEVKDRSKDIIISGGENISSIEVEKAIYSHHAIAKVAVIPMRNETWGEIVHAVVECHSETVVTEKEIIQFCKQKLPSYKCPKKVTFAAIPVNATGKIQKSKLKSIYYER